MEVMNGASIILLLGCGAIVVSAGPLSRPNSSTYSGPVGRRSQNYNSNVNTNIVSGAPPGPTEEEPNPTLEAISQKLYSEADPRTASLATSAAEAAMSIVKALTAELSETAAAAIAEAVSRILTGRSEPTYNRRNYNVNTNTNTNINTNIMGHGGERSVDRGSSSGGPSSADSLDLGNSLGTESRDPGLGSSNGLPYTTMNFAVPHLYGDEITTQAIEGVTREPDLDEDEEEKVISFERLAEADEFGNEAEGLASKSMGGQGWPRVNRRNINSNASKIRQNRRRNSNGKNEETDQRSSAYRRRVNPIGNPNATSFRHNINSNSNSNSNNIRRNGNSRMNRRSRSRRD